MINEICRLSFEVSRSFFFCSWIMSFGQDNNLFFNFIELITGNKIKFIQIGWWSTMRTSQKVKRMEIYFHLNFTIKWKMDCRMYLVDKTNGKNLKEIPVASKSWNCPEKLQNLPDFFRRFLREKQKSRGRGTATSAKRIKSDIAEWQIHYRR